MDSRKNMKNRKINNKYRKPQRQLQAGGPRVTISRTPFLMPERLSVKLQWTAAYTITNAGFKDAAYVLRPSSIYDVDPAIGGAKAYGLTEYSEFYSKYRVFSSAITVYATNLELEGTTVFITPSTTNPGNNMTDIGPYISNPLTKFRIISGYQGNASSTVSHYMTTQRMAGVQTTAEDGYSALVSTNPVENWYWVIGLAKAGIINFTNGVSMIIKVECTVHFYDRKVLEATLSKVHTNQAEPTSYPPPIPVYLTNAPVPPAPLRSDPTPPAKSIKLDKPSE